MKNENAAFDIILSPVITEKSTNLNALNKLTFKVAKDANKSSIKKSIEKLYKVVRGKVGSKTGYKKAIVTLKEGQTIDMTAGV
jgi:large subunit ribosomal protein L23